MAKPMTRTGKSTSRAVDVAERQAKALEMRKAGATYDDIKAACGFADKSGAFRAVRAALADITAEPAADVKKLELERLDGLYRKAIAVVDFEHPEDGPGGFKSGLPKEHGYGPEIRLKAIQTALKVQERRARLLGLDAPVKVQEVPPAKLSDEQLAAELRAELAKLERKAS